MFNLKNAKSADVFQSTPLKSDQHLTISEAQVKPYEKYNRENSLGPKVEETASITEKTLTHRTGYEETTTQDQLIAEHTNKEKSAQINEKKLEKETSNLVEHRKDFSSLSVPPINILVEQIRQKRLAEDYHTDKTSNWTYAYDDKKQLGSLPRTKKNTGQHDKIVLNNDPNRFTSSSSDPTTIDKAKITPLIGKITTADIHRVADGIKTGASTDYDTAIMAILRLAHDERRELSQIERNTVVSLKTARTNKLLCS